MYVPKSSKKSLSKIVTEKDMTLTQCFGFDNTSYYDKI